jgi:lysozyme family protein
VLAFGLGGAAVFYWIRSRAADAVLDDMTALGYTRSLQHGMGVMMGTFGGILTEWQQRLTSPLGQALTIATCAGLLAGYFFRVAWVLDEDENEP